MNLFEITKLQLLSIKKLTRSSLAELVYLIAREW